MFNLITDAIISPVSQQTQLAKISSRPFDLQPIFESLRAQEMFSQWEANYSVNVPQSSMQCIYTVMVGAVILNKVYGQDIRTDSPMILTLTNRETGQVSYFKTQMIDTFVEVKLLKPKPTLTHEQINLLLANIYDSDLWLQLLPPDHFVLEGFTIGYLLDITQEEALSRIKQTLLGKDAIVSRENVDVLEKLVQTYLRIPDLRLGITALDYPQEFTVAHAYKIRFDFLADVEERLLDPANEGSVYEKACRFREVLLVEDLSQAKRKTPIEKKLLERGVRSLLVAPLMNRQDRVIGLLEIGAALPYSLRSMHEILFRDITGLFGLALERSRDEIDNQIEAIIREQFTDIHPSVDWRFVEAAYNLMEQRQNTGTRGRVEPILFPDVFPFYGQADIVGSSTIRNDAIQADLLQNLTTVREVLQHAATVVTFPLIGQLVFKINRCAERLQAEFSSNDESEVVELLQREVHPLLELLGKQHPILRPRVDKYFTALDPHLGIIYDKRKSYEDSVQQVNEQIAAYLEEQDRIHQEVIPHYFSKYKTDGVEYELYVGQSLLRGQAFSEMHLRNLRLWQLQTMVAITQKINALSDQLPTPLVTAQLIFAYTNPLSIRFRQDEKQFDVDGAYNVRYEILKKRIDKAVIEGTEERITQPGKIAIVYLQDRDRTEYLEYIDYLLQEGLITDEVEDLRLRRLQGAQGLRALRVTVRE